MPVPCRSCQAPVVWAITAKTGSKIPLDPHTSPSGTIAVIGTSHVTGQPLAHVFTQADLALARAHGTPALFTSHFATCPQADAWRKSTPKGDT